MVNKLQFLRSLNAGISPAGLSVGEIAFNLSDKKLFVGSGGDTIVRLDGTTESVAIGTGYFESDLTTTSANSYTDQKIAELIDAAPDLLNTLNELAAAIADDPNFVTTITTAVSGVQTNLNNEIARATAAEGSLTASLNAEVSRAQGAEGQLAANLNTEELRALAAEGAIAGDLATEISRAGAAEGVISSDLANEISRAQAAESQLGLDLANEILRAQSVEAGLQGDISTESARAQAAEGSEAARAQAAEGVISGNLANEIARAQAAEATLSQDTTAAVNAEAVTRAAADNMLSNRISAIENGIDLGTFDAPQGGGSMSQA
jgi:hypothetical protein